jgi:DNA-binding NarL/FixJ family response regulator
MAVKSIYIVDSENMFTECLKLAIESSADIEVKLVQDNSFLAYKEIKSGQPDLVITELKLEAYGGINLIRKLKASGIAAKTILLSSDITPSVIHKALSAGVDGIIAKNDHLSLLMEAISVIQTRKFLSPAVSDPLVYNFLDKSSSADRYKTSPLSDREEEVARLIGEGISSRDIAEALSISEKTVSKHRSNIFKKLDIKNTAQLVRYVYDNDLID